MASPRKPGRVAGSLARWEDGVDGPIKGKKERQRAGLPTHPTQAPPPDRPAGAAGKTVGQKVHHPPSHPRHPSPVASPIPCSPSPLPLPILGLFSPFHSVASVLSSWSRPRTHTTHTTPGLKERGTAPRLPQYFCGYCRLSSTLPAFLHLCVFPSRLLLSALPIKSGSDPPPSITINYHRSRVAGASQLKLSSLSPKALPPGLPTYPRPTYPRSCCATRPGTWLPTRHLCFSSSSRTYSPSHPRR